MLPFSLLHQYVNLAIPLKNFEITLLSIFAFWFFYLFDSPQVSVKKINRGIF